MIKLSELEVHESLGIGSSGEVKKANHKSTGYIFALKIIPLRFDVKMKQLIEQEVRALHNCKNENIIKCFASFFHVQNFIKKRKTQLKFFSNSWIKEL